MKNVEIEIGKLYEECVSRGYNPEKHDKYELIFPKNMEILTIGNRYVRVKCLSKHKTEKHLLHIFVKSKDIERDVIVTTDHICMVYCKENFFENTNAKYLTLNSYVSIYDEKRDMEVVGTITKIDDLGTTSEYVYDIEVDDKYHSFYANDILIHNSIFLNLEPITDWMKKENGLPEYIKDWKKKDKKLLWDTTSKFVESEVNDFVRGLAHDFCHTNEQNVLTYELEYMSDVGVYERKKHYATHKIFDEGDPVDKVKYSGIEMKKATLPKFVKKYLQEIYEGVILHDWTNSDYQEYIEKLYDEFKTFSLDDISFWKGYNTERESSGFLQMAMTKAEDGHTIGTTGIAKAATFYNQIIAKLGLGKKYDQLRVGDKCRFLYIDPNNSYGIDVMAYKDGQWPTEFNEIFKPDYKKMFEKTVLDSLKSFREACRFPNLDPSKQVEFDIFSV